MLWAALLLRQQSSRDRDISCPACRTTCTDCAPLRHLCLCPGLRALPARHLYPAQRSVLMHLAVRGLQEAERVMATFVEHLHLPVTHVDDSQRTLARLKAGATPQHSPAGRLACRPPCCCMCDHHPAALVGQLSAASPACGLFFHVTTYVIWHATLPAPRWHRTDSRPLQGVSDPEKKRKIIGAGFIEVFNDYAKSLEGKLGSLPHFLVQVCAQHEVQHLHPG